MLLYGQKKDEEMTEYAELLIHGSKLMKTVVFLTYNKKLNTRNELRY